MPTTPIERLLFAQGGLCFFCKKVLPAADASVEHLVATANSGGNRDDNCVACCKSLNSLLGSMSLKEKIQVILNQKGPFKCPNGSPKKRTEPKPKAAPDVDRYKHVVANLKQRGTSKPGTVAKLKSTIGALFQGKLPIDAVESLVQQLQSGGVIFIVGSKITYA